MIYRFVKHSAPLFELIWKQKSWTSDILRILTLEFWRHSLHNKVLNHRQKRNRHKSHLKLLDKLAGDEKELNIDAMNSFWMFWSTSIFLCLPKVRRSRIFGNVCRFRTLNRDSWVQVLTGENNGLGWILIRSLEGNWPKNFKIFIIDKIYMHWLLWRANVYNAHNIVLDNECYTFMAVLRAVFFWFMVF